jgi:hypothetical protein
MAKFLHVGDDMLKEEGEFDMLGYKNKFLIG